MAPLKFLMERLRWRRFQPLKCQNHGISYWMSTNGRNFNVSSMEMAAHFIERIISWRFRYWSTESMVHHHSGPHRKFIGSKVSNWFVTFGDSPKVNTCQSKSLSWATSSFPTITCTLILTVRSTACQDGPSC